MDIHKIGTIEAIALICIVIANHIIINIPETIIESTGSSAWVNVIFVSIFAIIFVLLICKLFNKFSGKDILDISTYIGGRWIKTIIGIAYIGLFVLISATILRYFTSTLKAIYFPKTPIYVLMSVFLIAIVVANKTSFKSISYINIIIILAGLFSMLVLFLSTSKDFVLERFFPILGYGLDATFFSGLTNIFSFGGIAFLFFIMPMLKDFSKFKKISVISIVISSIYLFFSVVSMLFVFSYSSSTGQTLAIYSLTRIIKYSRFFQRVDALFIFIWILLVLSYLSIVTALCLNIFKKITNISDTKPIIYPFVILLFGISFFANNVATAKFITENIYKYLELILVFGVSFIILIIANIKLFFKKGSNLW